MHPPLPCVVVLYRQPTSAHFAIECRWFEPGPDTHTDTHTFTLLVSDVDVISGRVRQLSDVVDRLGASIRDGTVRGERRMAGLLESAPTWGASAMRFITRTLRMSDVRPTSG